MVEETTDNLDNYTTFPDTKEYLSLTAGDLRSRFILLYNENKEDFSMKGFEAVSGNKKYVFDIVIKPGEALVILAPSNTTNFSDIKNQLELPAIFWEGDQLTILREDGEVFYDFID